MMQDDSNLKKQKDVCQFVPKLFEALVNVGNQTKFIFYNTIADSGLIKILGDMLEKLEKHQKLMGLQFFKKEKLVKTIISTKRRIYYSIRKRNKIFLFIYSS